MKTTLAVLIACLFLGGMSAQARVSIADIQKAVAPGIDGTYPSPYTGRMVTITGVVTAVGFDGGSFFVSMPTGGSWSGICVEGDGSARYRGDYLEITGRVVEAHGFTTIGDVSRIADLGTRELPAPVSVTAYELSREERYEGVLVQVRKGADSPAARRSNRWTDSSGECRLDDRFDGVSLPAGPCAWSEVTGISVYAFGEYRLNPRDGADLADKSPVHVTHPSWGRVKSLYK